MLKKGTSLVACLLVITIAMSIFFLPTAYSPIAYADGLMSVGSEEQYEQLMQERLKQLEEEYKANNRFTFDRLLGFGGMDKAVSEDGALSGSANESPASAQAEAEHDFSGTNVQVQGVDEADMIKTDGQYLYQLAGSQLIISQIYPATEMKMIKELTFHKQFYPTELYVDGDQLIVIGRQYEDWVIRNPFGPAEDVDNTANTRVGFSEEIALDYIMPAFHDATKVYIYNIADPYAISLEREAGLEGSYLSSRKIDDSLYIITNKYINYWMLRETKDFTTTVPTFQDVNYKVAEAHNHQLQRIPYQDIYYFPDTDMSNYLMVAGINLSNAAQEININAYLGAGETVYANREHLYISQTRYTDQGRHQPALQETDIHKFSFQAGTVEWLGKGTVPGHPLNQFAMDEYKGHFRIATTSGEMWRSDQFQSQNNMYVLNEQMKLVGKVENLAPGERIYSVRFMGDRGYMVTFETVDPLFVIDLSIPENPQVLGELKIPGFSDYLHPLSDNLLIGFGKDTIVRTMTNWDGSKRDVAIEDGVKISIFDVSDVHNPIERQVVSIGDRGTHSPLNYNHKALLFAKHKELFAFPIYETRVTSYGDTTNPFSANIEFAFQGAYVYRITEENGLELRSKISHVDQTKVNTKDYYYYDDSSFIERILYINDTLYTVSSGKIQAHDLETMTLQNQLQLPRLRY